jgi:predicted PurR-regulated permease PerM
VSTAISILRCLIQPSLLTVQPIFFDSRNRGCFFHALLSISGRPEIQHSATAILSLTRQQARHLITGVNETIVASVYGGIAVGLAEGLLTALAFWVLGSSSPVLVGSWLLWSLIPVVGTGIVWLPAVVVLIIGGHWVKGLILIGWGAEVVGQVDALLSPCVVSQHAKMHNLLIFFALLGVVRAFGIMGLFIGPVVISVTIAVLNMLREINVASQQSEHRKQTEATGAE